MTKPRGLSETQVRNAKPDQSRDLWLNDGRGLYLRVRRTGAKSWVVRRKVLGKTQIITLGQYPTLALKEARAKAAQYQLRQDISSLTVAKVAKKYLEEVVNPNHRRPHFVRGYIDRAVLPALGHRKARDVTRAELVLLVQEYSKRGARSADQLRSNLRAMFGYAVELGVRDDNPMLEVTRRVTGYHPAPRDRTLSDDEIRRVWAEDHHHARLLRFLLLTGVRIGEAQLGQPWNADGSIWTIPASIAKNRQEHWVYLTDTASAQLATPFETSPTAVQAWLRSWCARNAVSPAFTPHDCRRTFVTKLNNLGVLPHIVEKTVGHALPGVLAVYNHAEYRDERIAAMKTLEAHMLELTSDKNAERRPSPPSPAVTSARPAAPTGPRTNLNRAHRAH